MPGSARSEVYFMAAMMVVMLIVCAVAVYFFFKTYKKEMAEKAKSKATESTPEQEAKSE